MMTLIVFRFYRNCSLCDYIKSSNTKDVLNNNQLHQLMFQQLRTQPRKITNITPRIQPRPTNETAAINPLQSTAE